MRLLEAARWAPTAHNMQNFELLIVDDPMTLARIGALRSSPSETFLRENYRQLRRDERELRERRTGLLAELFPPSWQAADAKAHDRLDPQHSFLGRSLQGSPTLLLVTYDARTRAPASEGDVLGMMSLGCVLQNIWLTATALGIAVQVLSMMSSAEVEPPLQQILQIPAYMKIGFACRLGYPATLVGRYLRVRREVEQFTHYNRYASADSGGSAAASGQEAGTGSDDL